MDQRRRLKNALPPPVRRSLLAARRATGRRYYPYRSWSQDGEDMILRSRFADTADGTFVDIGAFHPRYASNTYALYRRGWRGINVDARPGSMRPFRRWRRGDTNLETGIAREPGNQVFTVFADGELSTFHPTLAAQRARTHRVDATIDVPITTLVTLLDEHQIAPNFELLCVDVEGVDLDVLQSNDWDRFRPEVVVVEAPGHQEGNHAVAGYLEQVGYTPFASTLLNLLFERTRP